MSAIIGITKKNVAQRYRLIGPMSPPYVGRPDMRRTLFPSPHYVRRTINEPTPMANGGFLSGGSTTSATDPMAQKNNTARRRLPTAGLHRLLNSYY